jgi:hypothetical protein
MKTRLAILSFAFLPMILVLTNTPTVWGQAATSLRGSVMDPSGAAIPNASVHLINIGTDAERTATTDAQGEYVFVQVIPGAYRLEVEITGFQKYVQSGIQLLVNLPATINVKMKLGSQRETVTVTEAAPILNTTDASEGNTMGQLQLEQLPIEARDIVQLLSLQPGVVYTSDRTDMDTTIDTRSGAVNGERSDQSNVSLDGVDDNQQASGQAFQSVLPVPIESVQEFRVSTSNYGADQGRSAGAQVALVTKSGTNAFHGSLYEFNRNRAGEANDYFIKSAQATDALPNVPLQLVRNVFGADIGGPVKKDRLFFFLNYEGHRVAQQDSAVREIPTASLRDGVIMYLCDQGGTGAPLDSRCNNPSTVMGKSGAVYNVPAGYYALGYTGTPGNLQSQIQGMDPLGAAGGPDPASLAYFSGYPLPNDQTVGDNYNYSGYRFAAPASESDDWLVGRIDYKITANGTQQLFWRGSGANDHQNQDIFLPGLVAGQTELPTGPEDTLLDRSKGFVLGYTAILRSNLVNNFHYGLTRQSINNIGDNDQAWIYVRGLDQGVTYNNSFTLPVDDFVDDLSWTKGNHTLDFGADIRLIRSASSNQNQSFSYAYTNSEWLDTAGFAGSSSSPFNPANSGYPGVDSSFDVNYDWPLIGMLGMVTEDNAQTNFLIGAGGSATTLDQGAPVSRHFSTNEFEFYAQDSWKIRPNLTFNYGLRYELMSPVGEVNGQEVMPTIPLGQWFNQRAQNALQGIPSNVSPNISFDLAGPEYGRPSFYPWQTKNFAPRVSLAWSPQPSSGILSKLLGSGGGSVFRAGFGMYYDQFGYELVQTYDQNGSFGLLSNLGNPAGVESAACSPRLTSFSGSNAIPQNDLCGNQMYLPTATPQFPDQYPQGNFCICWGVDNNLKTPYSYALDLSYQRQIKRNMSIEFAYVGHLAHRLLAQDDLAMPLNLVDSKSGVSYFTAVQALAKQYENGTTDETFNQSALGSTAAYWQDMVAPLQSGGAYAIGASPNSPLGGCYDPADPNPPTSTTNPVVAAFDLFCSSPFNETTALAVWDLGGIPDANLSGVSYLPTPGQYSFFDNQFSSLYAWRTMAPAWYHGLQVTLKQDFSHGLQFDLNYTYSKSIDIASDAERIGTWGGLGGWITNAWDPNQGTAPSDFDLRHQINANWVWQLPFGEGRAFGNSVGKGMQALLGGWQISGLARWSSGFPVTVDNGGVYPTDWQLEGHAALTGSSIPQSKTVVDGYVNMFSDPTTAYAGFRHDLPGESGARNAIRGDGYAGLDLGLDKTWKMPYNEDNTLEFTWNVFNVPNLTRFDVQTASLVYDQANTFGRYTHLLTNPRVMQFGLSYAF